MIIDGMKKEILAGGKLRTIEITYRKNKNIWLRIGEDGTLKISCGRRVPESEILKFIKSKEDWIIRTEEAQKQKSDRCAYGLDGYAVWMGRKLPCESVNASRNSVTVEEDRIVFRLKDDTPEIRRRVFYNEAGRQLVPLINERRGALDEGVCRSNGKPLPKITVRYMTSRWGSCTPKKANISISSRLIHFPPVCLDYVLAHEYSHMLVANHSRDFYEVLGRIMPGFRDIERMLK